MSTEINRKRILRAHLTLGQQFKTFIEEYLLWLLVSCLIIALLMPALSFLMLVCFIALWPLRYIYPKRSWLVAEPVYTKVPDFMLRKKLPEDCGLLYLGQVKRQALWLPQQALVTHMAVFGTTGAGKTEFLLGQMFQLMMLGSGFIYVDGKGDVKTWMTIYSMAKMVGLQANLLVLNFFTGEAKGKISHTCNPFALGTADSLMEMLSGMLPADKGQGMWRDRAEALGRCLLGALCELRDQGELNLTVETIRKYLPLPQLQKLLTHRKLSATTKQNLTYYLNDLPGWQVYAAATSFEQREKAELEVHKQHGYLTMQYTELLGLLANTYGHITRTDLSEVDFLDVILNRRFLYIMLPSLEKSEASLKKLGRMIVMNLRNALSKLLGSDQLSGTKAELLENKPYSSPIPFGLFLDEYGSYCVEGFAEIATKARSLNVMTVFGGQDYESFEKGSVLEAKQIDSNTGIKVFMKTESSNTNRYAIERGGKAYHYLGENIKPQEFGYKDTGDGRLHEINRIASKDLVGQQAGECHVTYGDQLWQVKAFHGKFELADSYTLNEFIPIPEVKC